MKLSKVVLLLLSLLLPTFTHADGKTWDKQCAFYQDEECTNRVFHFNPRKVTSANPRYNSEWSTKYVRCKSKQYPRAEIYTLQTCLDKRCKLYPKLKTYKIRGDNEAYKRAHPDDKKYRRMNCHKVDVPLHHWHIVMPATGPLDGDFDG